MLLARRWGLRDALNPRGYNRSSTLRTRPGAALCFFPQSPQISNRKHRQVRYLDPLKSPAATQAVWFRALSSLRCDLSVLRLEQGNMSQSRWSLQGSSALC